MTHATLALLLTLAADPLPEGDQGIAAGYPNDEGIEGDAMVLFADDFEGYVESTDLDANWESVFQYDQIRFATEPENVFSGAQAIEFTVPQQEAELSNGTTKWVSPEPDALFLRYYTKFDAPYDVVGSSHNGSMISAHYFDGHNATPGIPADGTNKWLVNLENWRGEPETMSPGLLNVYVYHPEQRDNYGDHFFPSGLVMPNTSLPYDFGPDFVPRDEIISPLQTWQCWEVMVVANTPGERDGRIAAWIDGVLVADWQNLRLRDVPELTIDRFGIGFHIGSNPNGVTRKWYDDLVAAHAYIGPMATDGPSTDSGADSEGGVDSSGSADDDAGTEGGDDDGVSASADDDGGSATNATASAGESGSGDEGVNAEGDSGCGCRASDDSRAAWLGVLVFLLVISSRRDDRSHRTRDE